MDLLKAIKLLVLFCGLGVFTSAHADELKQIGTHLDHLFDIMGSLVLLPLLRLAANLDIADLLKDKPQPLTKLSTNDKY